MLAFLTTAPCASGSGTHAAFVSAYQNPRGFLRMRDNRGVAALEFAIVAPVMLLMMLGLFMFGIYLIFIHEVQEIASSAARSSVAGLNEAERNTLAEQYVSTAVANSMLLNPADLTVQTATSGNPPVDYSVTITYDLKDTAVPMLAQFISVPVSNITRTSTIEFGGY